MPYTSILLFKSKDIKSRRKCICTLMSVSQMSFCALFSNNKINCIDLNGHRNNNNNCAKVTNFMLMLVKVNESNGDV